MHEEWRDIPGFPNYQVSSLGRARSVFSGVPRNLKLRLQKGYHTIHTFTAGKDINIRINRAVCLAFHGAPPSADMVAAHNDGDKLRNVPENVRWATQAENAADRTAHGRPYSGGENPNAKLSAEDVLAILGSSESGPVLARRFGVSRNQIWRIRKGECWRVTTLRAEAVAA